jgi:hypothetical protein
MIIADVLIQENKLIKSKETIDVTVLFNRGILLVGIIL